MTTWYLLPLSVGICIVMQGVLNKQFSLSFGLSTASLLNALVFAVLAFVVFIVSQKFPLAFADFIPPKLSHYEFRFWHLVPGLCGFLIVTLTPWSIKHLGAAQVFILVIGSQILFSSLWDYLVNSITFSPLKLVGLALVAIGATLFSLFP
jgi:transporter family-2 protein